MNQTNSSPSPIVPCLALLLILLALSLGACTTLPAMVAQSTSAATPSPLPATPIITPTASATATQKATLTFTITPTATLLPSPTPTLHPMDVRAARLTPYPGSEIVIEDTLEPGSNYFRYDAYYYSEGLKIYGLLTVPYAEVPETGYPAIVFNHGYIPPDVYRTTQRYIAYVDNLAKNGYVVFRIDYRGHDRSEGEARGAYSDPGYLADVLNAVAALQQHPLVDPQRIGMWGHSMGGYLTLRAMTVSPDIRAGVIWSGVVASYPDLLCCWRRSQPFPTPTPDPIRGSRGWRSWVELYGSPEQNPEFWNSISTNAYLSEISGPLQLHHGTGDEDVPYEFSLNLYQEMLQLGLPVEYYQYEGDNHDLANYFSLAINRTLEFYARYLKNTP
mgnify:CR=1 FL=1